MIELLEKILQMEVFEGTALARKKYVQTGKLSKNYFSAFVEADPSPTKKYVEWMCKIAWEQSITDIKIIQIIRDFDRLASKGYLENTDIYKYKTIEEVEAVFESPKGAESLKKLRKERESEVEKVLDNEDFLVIAPKTLEAMQKYGRGTRWCVTNQIEWEDYAHDGSKIYVVINKKQSISFKSKFYPINSKFALVVKNNVNADNKLSIYDDEDKKFSTLNEEQFLKFMGFNSEEEALEKLFKPFTDKEWSSVVTILD